MKTIQYASNSQGERIEMRVGKNTTAYRRNRALKLDDVTISLTLLNAIKRSGARLTRDGEAGGEKKQDCNQELWESAWASTRTIHARDPTLAGSAGSGAV